jgi:hypothetical protein
MLVVDFFEVSDGRNFKEMVEDIQTMLLTGGIHTNIFRPKLVQGRGRTERPLQVIMYVDGRKHAEQAAEFLRSLSEVKKVAIEHSQEVEYAGKPPSEL